jgi:hypothetical protein
MYCEKDWYGRGKTYGKNIYICVKESGGCGTWNGVWKQL